MVPGVVMAVPACEVSVKPMLMRAPPPGPPVATLLAKVEYFTSMVSGAYAPQRGAAGTVGGDIVADHGTAHRQRAAAADAALEIAGQRRAVGVDRAAATEIAGIGESLRRIDRLVVGELRADDGQPAELGVQRAAEPGAVLVEAAADDGHLGVAAGEDGAAADAAAVGQELAVEDFQFAAVADLDRAAAPGARVVGLVGRRLHRTAVLQFQVAHRQRAAGVDQQDSDGLATIQGDPALAIDHSGRRRRDDDRTVDRDAGRAGRHS